LAALREAKRLLDVLPEPGQSLTCVLTGRYDAMDLFDLLLERFGSATHVRLATLTYKQRNHDTAARWIQSGAVQRLTLLVSLFCQHHYPQLCQSTQELLRPPHRFACARCHVKVYCLHFPDDSKWVCHGSPNLRCCGNHENLTVERDDTLHDWWGEYIDTQVLKHGG
jgi:hypothetical protein